MTRLIEESWRIIESIPEIAARIRRGYSTGELVALQARIGSQLPSDVLESLAKRGTCDSVLTSCQLFYLDSISSTVRMPPLPANWATLFTRGPVSEVDRWTERTVVLGFLDPGWLALDFDPLPGGDIGQVVTYQYPGVRTRIARSFSDFMSRVADLVEMKSWFIVSSKTRTAVSPVGLSVWNESCRSTRVRWAGV